MSLLVQGRYGEDTAGIFRDLQRNSSAFSSQQLDILRPAVELAGSQQRHVDRGGRIRRRGGFTQNYTRDSGCYNTRLTRPRKFRVEYSLKNSPRDRRRDVHIFVNNLFTSCRTLCCLMRFLCSLHHITLCMPYVSI